MRVEISLVAAALLLAGCQKSQDRATEAVVEKIIASKGRESKVEIDRDHGEIRVTLGSAIRPSGWPAAVPIYPHAERAKIDRAGDASDRLSVTTADSIAELRAYYRDALSQDGWSLDGETQADRPLTARRGEEALSIAFARRAAGMGSVAQVEYRHKS